MNAVFNYSSLLITEDMQKLLNRGLNFCIKPLKINLSSILTDFKRFKRKMLWHEYFYGEDKMDYEAPLFKTEKISFRTNQIGIRNCLTLNDRILVMVNSML